MRLYLINPSNPMVSILNVGESRWSRFRVWKPLGLMVIAGLTPDDWEITIIDENLGVPDYSKMPGPDLVGITAFTLQAHRAYELESRFRDDGATVVMGGIHATMCQKEASRYADTVVTGEGESVWEKVLEDVRRNRLKPLYEGGLADMTERPPARHDLLHGRYAFGAIQTTRGCPLHCSFCSVTSFNGARFRQRPIEHVIREFERVPEDLVLIVDDNLIVTRREHVKRAKGLFGAIIDANLKKKWIVQATINDRESFNFAAKARGVNLVDTKTNQVVLEARVTGGDSVVVTQGAFQSSAGHQIEITMEDSDGELPIHGHPQNWSFNPPTLPLRRMKSQRSARP